VALTTARYILELIMLFRCFHADFIKLGNVFLKYIGFPLDSKASFQENEILKI